MILTRILFTILIGFLVIPTVLILSFRWVVIGKWRVPISKTSPAYKTIKSIDSFVDSIKR